LSSACSAQILSECPAAKAAVITLPIAVLMAVLTSVELERVEEITDGPRIDGCICVALELQRIPRIFAAA
jgi:hypothetical protein